MLHAYRGARALIILFGFVCRAGLTNRRLNLAFVGKFLLCVKKSGCQRSMETLLSHVILRTVLVRERQC